jgi:hypothetical protein
MILGDVLGQFDDPSVVAMALIQIGDLALLARAETMAEAHGETLGEYVAASVRLFSSDADADDWVAMMAAMGREADPGAICLRRMLEWAVSRDGQAVSPCGCGGGE